MPFVGHKTHPLVVVAGVPHMMGVTSAPPPNATSSSAAAAAGAGLGSKKEAKPTITGASTVVKRPLAHQDKAVTSMVGRIVVLGDQQCAATAVCV